MASKEKQSSNRKKSVQDGGGDTHNGDEEPFSPLSLELKIECSRVIYVINEMLRQMEIAVCLPQLLNKESMLRKHLSSKHVAEVFSACDKYINEGTSAAMSRRSYRSAKSSIKSHLSKAEPKVDQNLANAIKILANHRCSAIRLEIKELLSLVSEPAALFLNDLRQLSEIAKERLTISAPDEMKNERNLRMAWKNNEQTKALIVEVTKTLEDRRAKFKVTMDAKEAIINHHKQDIEHINRKCKEDVKKKIQDSEHTMIHESRHSEEQQEVLMADASEAQAKYDALLAANLTNEKELRVKKIKTEAQLISWLNKYDCDIGERQRILDDINIEFDTEKEEYNRIKALMDAQEEEYVTLMAEKEEDERLEMEDKLYTFLCHRAQRRIHQAWMAYKQRKIDKKREKAERAAKIKEMKAAAKLEKQQKALQKKEKGKMPKDEQETNEEEGADVESSAG